MKIGLQTENPGLCTGIYDVHLNKKLFKEYAIRKIDEHQTRTGLTLELRYNSRILFELYKDNQLANSPRCFFNKITKIVSYLKRRRRQCIIMNFPVPDPDYLAQVYHCGNYKCIPEWGECLQILNSGLVQIAAEYGCQLCDLDRLMRENGGPWRCLIDLWHFSEHFNLVIARELERLIVAASQHATLPADHLSRKALVTYRYDGEPLLAYGTGEFASRWLLAHPRVRVAALADRKPEVEFFHSLPVISEEKIESHSSDLLLLLLEEEERLAVEKRLLPRIGQQKIILYPEEFTIPTGVAFVSMA